MTDEPKKLGRPPGSVDYRARRGFGGNKQGERSVNVAVSIKPQLRELLVAAAADQYRGLAGQAAKYIVDGLIRDGYIKPSKTGDMP